MLTSLHKNGQMRVQWLRCEFASCYKDKFMVKAIVTRGEIRPLEPLPVDWQEGQRVRVEKADDSDTPVEEIDRDFAVLDRLCQASEPADEEQMERALQEAHRQAKEQVRRHMGLA
jgi:hypothetical protein